MRAFLRFENGMDLPVEEAPAGDAHIQLWYEGEAISEAIPIPFEWNVVLEIAFKPSTPFVADSATLTHPYIGTRTKNLGKVEITPPEELVVCWQFDLD